MLVETTDIRQYTGQQSIVGCARVSRTRVSCRCPAGEPTRARFEGIVKRQFLPGLLHGCNHERILTPEENLNFA